jgi:PDZ domain-containing secreted protein
MPFDARVPGAVTPVTVLIDGNELPIEHGSISTVSYRDRSVRRLEWELLSRQPGTYKAPPAPTGFGTGRPPRIVLETAAGRTRIPDVFSGTSQLAYAQEVAAFVALREAGKAAELNGAGIVLPGADLAQGYVVTKVGERNVRTPLDWSESLRATRDRGDTTVDLSASGGVTITIAVPPADSPAWTDFGDAGMAVFGVNHSVVSEHVVEFADVEDAEGASGGLAYALAAFDVLSPTDVTRGRAIVATGAVTADGHVTPVSGIESKVEAAVRAGANVIVVPQRLGPAATKAAASRIKVIAATTVRDAIVELSA